MHISELAHHHVENPREIVEPGQDVRVKILEIDSERRRLSLSVKRVEEQLAHIKSAAAAGAAAAGAAEEIGDVPDLGLSEDVFAGPQVSGADDLRAALSSVQAPEPAEPGAEAAPPTEPDAAEPEAELTEPEAGEPEAAEPEAAQPEPEAAEPAEPEDTETEAAAPEAAEPDPAEPEAAEPEAAAPEPAEPQAAQPEPEGADSPDEAVEQPSE